MNMSSVDTVSNVTAEACRQVLEQGDGVQIQVVRDVGELASLREIWNGWTWHPNSDPDSYLAVLKAMPSGVEPLVFVLYRKGAPQAMLVSRVENGNLSLRLGYKDLLKIKVRKLVCIYGGLLGDASSENCKALMISVNDFLRRGEADLAFFNSLRTDSPLYVAATKLQSFYVRDHMPVFELHRSMELPKTDNEANRRLSAKSRKEWRKLMKDFPDQVVIRCFRKPEELDDMFRDVEEVAKKTYQRGLGVGFGDTPLMRGRLGLEAERGWLRAYVLYLAGRPCAFWVGKLYNETFHSDSMGYDSEYRKYSPGMFVVMSVIEGFCNPMNNDAVRVVDFGLGDAEYKRDLGNSEWREASLYLFAPTVGGLGLNLFRTPAALANRLAKEYLDKASLLLKAKRIWRNQLRQQASS
jgi:hypothetical protein